MFNRTSRGFTLVELAIVIVIAGILAAVAIPIYQGLVEKGKWTEGKTGAAQIDSALKVLKAEHSNTLQGTPWAGGLGPNLGAGGGAWVNLELNESEFNGSTFISADYLINALNAGNTSPTISAATWQLLVADSAGDGPVGQYLLGSDGSVGGSAP